MTAGQWLIENGTNLNRSIRSLTRQELLGMAWAIIGKYNDLRAEREQLEAQRVPSETTAI
jgi:hypothetical protein